MDESIAIIGLDSRLPGEADSPEKFYEFLLAGRSARTETPPDRFNANAFWHPDPERSGSTRLQAGHYLKESIAAFDAPFFSITPAEARYMDPQQRILLESTYRALENAGLSIPAVAGSQTGVYVGCFYSDYNGMVDKDLEIPLKQAGLGSIVSILSNRLSWFFDFRGPSMTIDTACSSSLVAAHQACLGLKSREISMAVVAGCNLLLSPEITLKLSAAGVTSPTGTSHSFDHRADGYSRGEGFGVVVLKRVADAIRDGDVIRAVIRNTGSNQDGRSPGITQPTKEAQADLIKQVYSSAGLDPPLTRFIEAHGTGTPVGDPIEASAIGDVFSTHRSHDSPLYVGALKSNIGHSEGAAGVTSIIKGVLTLENGIIPANTWFEKVNPKIEDAWHLRFPTKATAWPQAGLRRMSINSFGIGGTNAHMVLDDAFHHLKHHQLVGKHRSVAVPNTTGVRAPLPIISMPIHISTIQSRDHALTESVAEQSSELVSPSGVPDSLPLDGVNIQDGELNGNCFPLNLDFEKSLSHVEDQVDNPQIFVWSSYDQNGISRQHDSYREYLISKTKTGQGIGEETRFLQDLSYTLAQKRAHHGWRSFKVAQSASSLLKSLGDKPQPVRAMTEPRLAFIFTGQGAQWPTMGRGLVSYPVFQQSLFSADQYLNGLGCCWSLMHEMSKDKPSSRIDDPEFCQPICTALQVALVDLFASWEVRPHAIAGHSSGEIAAAYAVGQISRESAWKIAYYRGKLSAQLSRSSTQPRSGMAAVALDEEGTMLAIKRASHAMDDVDLEIACMNGPESHTVSGNDTQINAMVEMLQAEKVFARKLNVDIGYHSRYMTPIGEKYLELIGDIRQVVDERSQALYFSALKGKFIDPSLLQRSDYWVENLVSPVRFHDAVKELIQGHGITDILELGPHGALKGPLRSIACQVEGGDKINYHTVLSRNKPSLESAIEAAGSLFCRGHGVNLGKVNNPRGVGGHSSPLMLVDLPGYSFNHSNEYWAESRLSKNSRSRPAPRHELLGVSVTDWNKENAIWRNWIRVSENPWLEDHRVHGNILYPAAGMLVMAIEACRQIADGKKVLDGFKFKEVSLHSALRVPDDSQGIESHFYLRPHWESTSSSRPAWSQFQLYTFQDGDWREHCRGLVQIEYQTDYTQVDGGLERQMLQAKCDEEIENVRKVCHTKLPSRKLYSAFRETGLEFGPNFQTLENVLLGPKFLAVAEIESTVSSIKDSMPHGYLQPHVVHPTTLDGLLQAGIAPLMHGPKRARQAMVPVYLENMWIAAAPLAAHDGYSVSTQAIPHGRHIQEMKASSWAVHQQSGRIAAQVDGITFKAVFGQTTSQTPDDPRHKAWHIEWKPDPTFLGLHESSKVFGIPEDTTQEVYAYMDECTDLCLLYLRRLLEVDSARSNELGHHHKRYISWARDIINKHHHKTSPISLCDLEGILKARNLPEGNLAMAVGQALLSILDGSVDPLEVIFQDTLARDFYLHGVGFNRCHVQMQTYLDALAHKNPSMKILEIGAGTGGTTKPVLDTLTQRGQRYDHFDFTDISPLFLEQAKEAFDNQSEHMSYRVLNIEKPPEEQGFELGTYDLIVAAKVLHATSHMNETLRNVRSLLKPGGELVLFEITDPATVLISFIFGLLPGWWLSEDADRVNGPLLSTDGWDRYLQASGFGGIDAVFDDFPDPTQKTTSIIVSTATKELPHDPRPAPTFRVFLDDAFKLQREVAATISKQVAPDDTCEILPFDKIPDRGLEDTTCIVLTELEGSFLGNMSSEKMAMLKRLMSCKAAFWLTRSGTTDAPSPDMELVTGLARSIRAEKPSLKFTTVSFDQSSDAQCVVEKLKAIILNSTDGKENSFRVENKTIKVPRLVQAKELTDHIREKTTPLDALDQKLSDAMFCRPLSLQIGTVGMLDTLRFEDDVAYNKPLEEDDVEFKVMASDINFRDLATSLGKIEEAPIGLEAAGVVTRVGSSVSRLQEGDKVFGLCFDGAIKTYARTRQGFLAKMPDNLGWTDAASIPIVYSTAFATLGIPGTVFKGDTILIHAAAGGFGQAAIQVAQHFGAVVFATVGSLEKRDFLESTYGIPRDHIFSSRDLSFKSGIQRMTNGRGVDIVLNSLSGEALRASWDCIAPFGRFVELGLGDIDASAQLSMGNFNRNTRFESVELAYVALHDPLRTERIFQQTIELVLSGQLTLATPVSCYSYSGAQAAFRHMQSGKHIGKLVLEPLDTDIVPVVPSQKPTSRFPSDATYVVAGGLGGLGRSVAEWMVARGAKNLILLSRRGPVEDAAKAFIQRLEGLCDNVVAPACDVTDTEALRSTLSSCMQTLPAIKGCIQGSMVLNDNRFEDMTLEEWDASVSPKTQGSLSLHNNLGDGLDFYILLSSTSAIVGGQEQSNYAAAGTYQDALARYLASQGLPAVSINLPVIADVGYVSEKPELMEHLRSIGWAHINEEEFHATLDYCCGKLQRPWSITESQAIPRLWLPQYSASEGAPLPTWRHDPIFNHLVHTGAYNTAVVDNAKSTPKDVKYGNLLWAATSPAESGRIVLEALLTKLARVLSVEMVHLDPAKPLFAYGVDSLVSVEIRSWMSKEIGSDLSSFDITSQSSIGQLAKLAAARSRFVPKFDDGQTTKGINGA